MGVVYKLKEEIKEFIIEEKKTNPHISCRSMGEHVKARFDLSLSKSSINALMKEVGLSAPIGRRPKKRKPHIAMPVLPALLDSPLENTIASTSKVEDSISKEELLKAKQERLEKEAADRAAQEAAEKERLEKEAALKAAAEEERLRIIEEERIKEIERLKKEERLKQEELKKAKEDEERKAAEELERKKREEEEISRREAEQKAKEAEEKRKQEEAEALRAEKEKWDKIARQEAQSKVALYPEIENSGLVLLDAADYLIGASPQIARLIGGITAKPDLNSLAKVKNLIYSPFFSPPRQEEGLDSTAVFEAAKIINNLLRESRCIRVTFSNGTHAFIDSCFYAVWSTSHIPYDFSNTVNNTANILNNYLSEDQPVVIFNAAGYDIPSPEFLRFLSALNSSVNKIAKITLFSGRLEEISELPLPSSKRRFFIFGLWPWQFSGYRKVDKIGEFRKISVNELKKDFYIADIELKLSNPETQEEVNLRGVSLKTNLNERVRLVILTNAEAQSLSAEELVFRYLSCWPNMEEAFEDYNRKIELFTYTANKQNFFSAQVKCADIAGPVGCQAVFDGYLKALDLYIRGHFLPAGYKVNDFSEMKSRFYDLPVESSERVGSTRYFCFKTPAGYSHKQALDYILRRLNERGVKSSDGFRVYFKTA